MKARNQWLSILASLAVLFLCCAVVGAPVPVQAQTVQVLSANPPSAAQGTVNLNVLIKGKGFKTGAIAKFLVTGTTDTGGVRVNSTAFVDATTLTANIDVADTAVLSKFDIQVMNRDGRGGKGTELFSVTKKQDTSCSAPPPVPEGGYCFSGIPGQAGCLDTNFGGGSGRVLAPRGLIIRGLAMQTIGLEERIVAVARHSYGTDSCAPMEGAIMRYRNSGELDTSFGQGGVVTGLPLTFTGGAVVVQPDNKLIVVGKAPAQVPAVHGNKPSKVEVFAVARYNPGGSLDTTFGTGGVGTMPYGSYGSTAEAVALQSDGKIVAAGNYGGGLIAVFRLNPDGTPDTTFNGTGVYVYQVSNGLGRGVAVQRVGSEERIVVAGRMLVTSPIQHNNAFLMRFTPQGALDTSFGGSGIVLTEFSDYYSEYSGLAVDSNNHLVAVGEVQMNSDIYSVQNGMARYDASGNLDPTFGSGGKVTAPSGEAAVAIQPDGYILTAGADGIDGQPINWMVISRFMPDGGLDPSFGDNGSIEEHFAESHFAQAYAIVQQADGKVVAAGLVEVFDDANQYQYTYAALARFWK
jgi:uncharacterized delta-60 repeat protein